MLVVLVFVVLVPPLIIQANRHQSLAPAKPEPAAPDAPAETLVAPIAATDPSNLRAETPAEREELYVETALASWIAASSPDALTFAA